jgi:nucleotide-binding universal stress UspA family protein
VTRRCEVKEFKKILFPVVFSKASEKIVPYVQMMAKEFESKGIDLVIMGTHGRKGLDKVIFGSVAERIVKTAPVPVLLINPYRESNISGRTDEKAEILQAVNQ